MRWWHRLMCRLGMHSYRFAPPFSVEELDAKMNAAKDDIEVFNLMIDSFAGCKWSCAHCDHERKIVP